MAHQHDGREAASFLRIGVDFDNTIVCYDDLFHQVALERGLIPTELPIHKSAVRDYLRAADQEDLWTEMQGYVYGQRMIADALPFAGVLEFFGACQASGIPTYIVSHKTRYPYLGEKYDLHAAARAWLEQHGLAYVPTFLELTKAEKLERIGRLGCTHFIDDLPEFLTEAAFPTGVERILFDPNDSYEPDARLRKMTSWAQIGAFFRVRGEGA